MNILVLGNGFDRAHKLETTYKDFLYFEKTFKDCYSIGLDGLNVKREEYESNPYLAWCTRNMNEEKYNSDIKNSLKELMSMVSDNL